MNTYTIKSSLDESGARYQIDSVELGSALSFEAAQKEIDEMDNTGGILVEDSNGNIYLPESPFKGFRTLYPIN